ncbi:L-lactate dehydrogenase complex protein LldG [bacterium A37T11]|nr:L-lactate dehydrogenase complex protein LldG [bacterium A37T11]
MAKNRFNPTETTPKEQLLKKIRKALLLKRDNPFPQLEEVPVYPPLSETPEISFAIQLQAAAGKFVFCEDELQLIEQLLAIAEVHQLRKMYVWEPDLQRLLGKYGFPFYSSDTGFADAEAGISNCEALIARSGSIIVSNATSAGRRLSIYPKIHIVIARSKQIVTDLNEGFQLLKQKYHSQLPSMVSVITGPSSMADIEKKSAMGVQGPKELYVLLLD